jgi:hypothetical protein
MFFFIYNRQTHGTMFFLFIFTVKRNILMCFSYSLKVLKTCSAKEIIIIPKIFLQIWKIGLMHQRFFARMTLFTFMTIPVSFRNLDNYNILYAKFSVITSVNLGLRQSLWKALSQISQIIMRFSSTLDLHWKQTLHSLQYHGYLSTMFVLSGGEQHLEWKVFLHFVQHKKSS